MIDNSLGSRPYAHATQVSSKSYGKEATINYTSLLANRWNFMQYSGTSTLAL